MHCDSLNCASQNSAGETDHNDPPNTSNTDTAVLQAARTRTKPRSTSPYPSSGKPRKTHDRGNLLHNSPSPPDCPQSQQTTPQSAPSNVQQAPSHINRHIRLAPTAHIHTRTPTLRPVIASVQYDRSLLEMLKYSMSPVYSDKLGALSVMVPPGSRAYTEESFGIRSDGRRRGESRSLNVCRGLLRRGWCRRKRWIRTRAQTHRIRVWKASRRGFRRRGLLLEHSQQLRVS